MFFSKESIKNEIKTYYYRTLNRHNKINKQYKKLLDKSILNSDFYAVSKSLKNNIKKIYNVNVRETLNNLSPSWKDISYRQLAKKTKLRKIKNILFVGHLIERKNIINLIRAFIKIKGSDLKFTIIGDGYLASKCHQLSKNDNRIKYIKNIDNNLLPYIYQENDLLILPSFEETFGVVIIEAASQGCQIASTISGGPEEIIRKIKNGYIIRGKNFNDIYSFLKKTINSNYDRSKLIKDTIDNYGPNQFLKSISL